MAHEVYGAPYTVGASVIAKNLPPRLTKGEHIETREHAHIHTPLDCFAFILALNARKVLFTQFGQFFGAVRTA